MSVHAVISLLERLQKHLGSGTMSVVGSKGLSWSFAEMAFGCWWRSFAGVAGPSADLDGGWVSKVSALSQVVSGRKKMIGCTFTFMPSNCRHA